MHSITNTDGTGALQRRSRLPLCRRTNIMLNMGKNQAKINHRKQANKHGGNGHITEFAFLKPPDSSFRFIIRSLRISSCYFFQ